MESVPCDRIEHSDDTSSRPQGRDDSTKMATFCGQFSLLLWKNYKLQSRRKLVTVFEIIMPLFFALILLVIKMSSHSIVEPDYTLSQPTEIKVVDNFGWGRILYAPRNNFTTKLVTSVGQMIHNRSVANITGFRSEEDLEAQLIKEKGDFYGAIVFLSDTENNSPLTLSYKLRLTTIYGLNNWKTGSTYDLFGGQRPHYASSGPPYEIDFIRFQFAVNKAFILQQKPDAFNGVKFFTQKMPYPPYTTDSNLMMLGSLLPTFIILSFILNVPQMAKNIAYEKENKLREAMKMMGLRTSIYWLSWFVKNMIYLLLVILLYTIICFIDTKNGRLFPNTDPTVFFVFMLLYILATIAFSFMISTFFKKANSASFAAGILYYLSLVPASIVGKQYEFTSRSTKMFLCLFHSTGMDFGFRTILIAESAGTGYFWRNIYLPGQIGDTLSLLDVMIMLIIDTVLYMIIAWYVDTVNPGDAGVAQPLWFPFTRKYWFGSKSVDSGYEVEDDVDEKYFEPDRSGAHEAINVQHLRKRFGANVAVNDVTMTMYEGQITALLGHNGAGKTTTISMLTGFLKPSGGLASIYGRDIGSNMSEIRKDIGLCPQHDILFDTLTVEEHLIFFAKLKGCLHGNVDEEVNEMLKAIGLEDKRNALSSTLSGGQKRKLSVGIALVAGSKIVILDEPSSGMDPAARRHMWDILQRYRAGRAIILTTHFMDEADILGDRIAIMAHGKLQCCGTSMFLKKLYGAGYHLVVVKDKDCNVDSLTQLIQRVIPSANIESHISSEISYLLPFNESDKFEELFNEIETNMAELGISSFGTSATTMEEVFLRVGEGATTEETKDKAKELETEEGATADDNDGNEADSDNTVIVNLTNPDYIGFNQGIKKNSSIRLLLQQCYAIFVKKCIHTCRNFAISIAQLILPVAFAILALSTSKANEKMSSLSPSLNLDLHPFPKYTVGFSPGKHPTLQTNELSAAYEAQFNGKRILVDRQAYASMKDFFVHSINEVGLPTFNREYIVGGEFEINKSGGLHVIAHYNGEPYHAMPISLQYAMNAYLKYVTQDESRHISVTNHPLPEPTDDGIEEQRDAGLSLSTTLLIVFGMAFMTATFSLFYIKERSTGAKHLQVVSGIRPVSYWLASFAWDLLNYTIPVILILVVYLAFEVSVYVDKLGYVFLVFMLYGWAALPFVYLLQHLFSKPPTGLILISLLNVITGLVLLLVVKVFQGLSKLEEIGDTLYNISLSLFPIFNLGNSLFNMFMVSQCSFGDCKSVLDKESPGIGRECLAMFIQGVVYMFIVLVIEYGLFKRILEVGLRRKSNLNLVQSGENVQNDSDVMTESDRINSTPIQDLKQTDTLILKNVSKAYRNGFQAVKNISCGIQANECFGLLGQNGAGKSSTLKMLTGEAIITSGDAYLNNLSIKSDLKQVHRNIGYCPQVDALIDEMTGRETLYMYARLRGIQETCILDSVNQLVDVLMLNEHIDKKTQQYSGGNKRKLSTAISLIGDPPLILLDEPTTGVDPAARRQLWNVIAGVRASGRTVVLISHSMEECDALCTKLVIMVNGNFVCLGSPQHLKNKFGHGYTLFCRMGLDESGNTASCHPLAEFVNNRFQGATVFDDNTGYVHFKIADDNASLGEIFGVMETLKKQYNVDDYSVHQTSLEQIFLSFIKSQIPPVEFRPNCCVRCGCICFGYCC